MSEARKAKVQVDLTPIRKGVVECDSSIAFNSLDQPEAITVAVTGLAADQLNTFCKGSLAVGEVVGNPEISGVMEGGDSFSGRLAFIKAVNLGPTGVLLECILEGVSRRSAQGGTAKGVWTFGLANYRVGIGDVSTELPPPTNAVTPEKADEIRAAIAKYHKVVGKQEGSDEATSAQTEIKVLHGPKRLNRIVFSFAGREWTLDDDLFGRWPKDDSAISEPVRSGTLSAGHRAGDSGDVLRQAADDISCLLSLALGRDIKWVLFGQRDEHGAILEAQYRNPGLLAFNQHGSRLADNWTGGNLKRFLEAGEAAVIADRDWWAVTVGLLTQARGSKYVEVKCSLLNTLLDRITTKVLGEVNAPEIDAGLDAKVDVKEFRVTLHYILSTLSPNWDRTRTDALCSTIKDWNARPSFPKKIMRACQKHGISPISGKKLGFRHVLIHDGEMHGDLKTPDDRAQYFFEIEMIVLLLLVRMLRFDGQIYLQCKPPDPKLVSEFLAETSQPNGGK